MFYGCNKITQTNMKMTTINLCVKVIVVIYVLVYIPSVSSSRRRSRTHKKSTAVENERSIQDLNGMRHYQTNDFDDDDDDDDDDENYLLDEFNNLSTNDKDVERVRRKRIDPKGSWLTFVNRLGESKPDKRKKKKKRNKKSNRNVLLGPQGPVGPPGPPGPPGSSFTKEEIIKELEDLIKEEAERRAQQMLADMVPLNSSSNFIMQPDQPSSILEAPRIYAGFSLRLETKARVLRKTFMEIKSFKQPFGDGAFQRGETFNAREGRFFAPREGVYQFTANLHMRIRAKRKLKSRPKHDEHLKVRICIDSLCQTNTSIETITGVNIDNRVFTASVSGFLYLKEKQYASLYVDNASSYNVKVETGSEYSGIFLGS